MSGLVLQQSDWEHISRKHPRLCDPHGDLTLQFTKIYYHLANQQVGLRGVVMQGTYCEMPNSLGEVEITQPVFIWMITTGTQMVRLCPRVYYAIEACNAALLREETIPPGDIPAAPQSPPEQCLYPKPLPTDPYAVRRLRSRRRR